MKIYPLLIVVLLFPYYLSAQSRPIEKVTLSVPSSNVRNLYPLSDKTISGIEVVMELEDTSRLGYAIKNEEEADVLQPDKPWQSWMQDFVASTFGSQLTSGHTGRMLLIVKDIRIQRDRQNKTALRFRGEVWKAQELADEYDIISRIDTAVMGDNGVSDQLAALLVSLMNPTTPLVQNEYKSIPRAQAINMIADPISGGAILRAKQYNEGVYFSFREFLDNSPSIKRVLAFPDSTDNDRLKIYELAQDSSKRAITDFWGICMNDEFYIVNNGILVPFEKNDTDFMLSAYIDPRDRKNHGRYRLLLGKKPNTPIHNTLTMCAYYNVPASRIDLKTGKLTF